MNTEDATGANVAEVVAAWVSDASGQSAPDVYYGKRQIRRYVWPAAIEVLVNPGSEDEERLYVTGQDVSDVGMGLLGRKMLHERATLWLRYADEGDGCPWVPARVVHSTQSVGGYRTGVHFILD